MRPDQYHTATDIRPLPPISFKSMGWHIGMGFVAMISTFLALLMVL